MGQCCRICPCEIFGYWSQMMKAANVLRNCSPLEKMCWDGSSMICMYWCEDIIEWAQGKRYGRMCPVPSEEEVKLMEKKEEVRRSHAQTEAGALSSSKVSIWNNLYLCWDETVFSRLWKKKLCFMMVKKKVYNIDKCRVVLLWHLCCQLAVKPLRCFVVFLKFLCCRLILNISGSLSRNLDKS